MAVCCAVLERVSGDSVWISILSYESLYVSKTTSGVKSSIVDKKMQDGGVTTYRVARYR